MGTCEDQCPSIDLANEISLDADSNGVVVHHSDGGDRDDSSEQALIQRLEDSHIVENGEEEEKKEEDEVEGRGELGGVEEQGNENDGPAKEGEEENEREEDEKNEEELQNESRNHPYPLRSNAEDCSFYMKTGSCKYGFNCRFNHPVNRVNQVVDADSREHDAQRTDANGKIECKYYSTPGGCKYGDTCRYNHPKEEIDSEPLELNFLGLPIRKGEKECPYYMRNGSCGYGANCRFHHPDPAAAMEEPKNLMPNGGALHGGRSFAGRNTADCAPSMSSMPRSISNSSSSENIPSYMPWMNAIPQGMPQLSAYNQYQVPVSLPDKNMASRPGYSVNTPLKKADTFGFNPQLMRSEEFPERPGQPDCDYFMRTGTCKYRSDCRFHHPKSRIYSMPNGAIQNTMKEASPLTYHTQMSHMEEYPERPGEPECAYFMKTGDCKYKSNCKFHHPKGRSPKLTASTYGVSGLASRSAPIVSHEVKKLPDLYPSHVNQMAKPFMHHPLPTKVEEFPDRPGQPECEYFMKTGDCKYKLMCRYHHPKSSRSQVSAGSDFAVNEKGLPLRPGAKICRNYEQLGICKYGPRCLFDHPSSSNSSVIPESSAPQSPPGNSSGWDDDWVIG